jgi:hypothetical protein
MCRLLSSFVLVCLASMLSIPGLAQPARLAAGPPATESSFSFVVHGDLTGGERPGIFSVAARQIALLQPDFVIGVGDLIEGDGQDAAALNAQWSAYERRAAATTRPVYLVGGNHDLTSALQREVWQARYGPTYYHFRHADALFLVLDTEDYLPARRAEIVSARDAAIAVAESEGWDAFERTEYAAMPERFTGAIGADQQAYFRRAIADNPDVRWTFVFLHKAPWEGDGDAGFAALEALLRDRPYTVFHGHEHAQRHLVRNGRDYIRLATTGGVQLTDNGRAVDHISLVTVADTISIATLDLGGIRDAAGGLPGDGNSLCFDILKCAED